MPEPEILIIGAGPAGLTAGIYASRAGHHTLILEKEMPGGQMLKTTIIENYPGFAQPVNGLDLVQQMEAQAKKFGSQIEIGEAKKLRLLDQGFELETTGNTYHPRSIIICTGASPRPLGLANEKELTGRGISYCAICDGPLYQGKEVAVVGGGDSALQEADYLTRFCVRVHLIHRREEFRAVKVLQDRVRTNPKINLYLAHIITGINGTNRLESLELKNLKTGATTTVPVAGLFIYIGLIPDTGWCADIIKTDENGFIITDDKLQTTVPGIFAAGDVRQKELRQIATAVGDGALAAMNAHDFCTRHKN